MSVNNSNGGVTVGSSTSTSTSSTMPPTTTKQFHKVLIANRGEIAVRVMRTCKALGFSTVAVYSSADADSVHVRVADEAVLLGSPVASDSYLNIEKIIAACKQTGADAVHPCYGFLSENPKFAAACTKNDIVFIGPSPDSMLSLGNKAAAKALMAAKCPSVPLIPGYDGDDQSLPRLLAEAKRVGFPLLCKAAAGGGGKGMRVVKSMEEMTSMIESVISEAKNSFGDSHILLERYFEVAHHIEFQIFGDHTGDVVHLGERECSVQRRYQKVVEEAPSPFVTPELRARMGAAAEEIGRSCAYVGAGTVEFLVDEHRNFYFLEVNTRLQVEHPITECIRGLDLVALQLHIAAGATLAELGVSMAALEKEAPNPLAASIRAPRAGHAIECRLYAEDPCNNFFPATGRLLAFVPSSVAGVRYDSGVESGADVSVYYDPLLAKVIAWGATRAEAVRRMQQALAQTIVMGIVTNQRFLAQVLAHPEFASGIYNTTFIPTLLPAPARLAALVHGLQFPRREEVTIAAAVADVLRRRARRTYLAHLPVGYNGGLIERYTQVRISLPLVKTINEDGTDGKVEEARELFYLVDNEKQTYGAEPTANRSMFFKFKFEDAEREARKVLIASKPIKPPSSKSKGKKGGSRSRSPSPTRSEEQIPEETKSTTLGPATSPSSSSSSSFSSFSPIAVELHGYAPLSGTSAVPAAASCSVQGAVALAGNAAKSRPQVVVLDLSIVQVRAKYVIAMGTGVDQSDDVPLDIWVRHPHPSVGCVLARRHSRFEAPPSSAGASGATVLLAPMPCKILKIAVESGTKVVKKQLVIVVESMKMEMRILAETDGVFTAHVKPGEIVKEGHKLGVIEPSPASS